MNTFVKYQSGPNSPWFHVKKPNPNASFRLFCFPYAGGSASIFHHWAESLDSCIELVCIQLPGRGARFCEPLVSDQNTLLQDLESEILPWLDKPYAFFGHSMGAQLAFDLCRRLRRSGRTLPHQLMVSSRLAPQSIGRKAVIHDLPEAEFLKAIARLNGMPKEVTANPELLEIVSPVLRSDAKLVETWRYRKEQALPVPISAFGGVEDRAVKPAEMREWAEHTSRAFRSFEFEGDHFYLHQGERDLLAQINSLLSPLARGFALYGHKAINEPIAV